uniref:hypothetical protein n=1 Tax=Polypodium hydriforme TaxID=43186 RepID=UPI002115B369|nr:hypothetical protein NQY43_mgp02 [Polypodium hydriforme]USZ79603.1 hypothetical protein [Polypodium hydriforme]
MVYFFISYLCFLFFKWWFCLLSILIVVWVKCLLVFFIGCICFLWGSGVHSGRILFLLFYFVKYVLFYLWLWLKLVGGYFLNVRIAYNAKLVLLDKYLGFKEGKVKLGGLVVSLFCYFYYLFLFCSCCLPLVSVVYLFLSVSTFTLLKFLNYLRGELVSSQDFSSKWYRDIIYCEGDGKGWVDGRRNRSYYLIHRFLNVSSYSNRIVDFYTIVEILFLYPYRVLFYIGVRPFTVEKVGGVLVEEGGSMRELRGRLDLFYFSLEFVCILLFWGLKRLVNSLLEVYFVRDKFFIIRAYYYGGGEWTMLYCMVRLVVFFLELLFVILFNFMKILGIYLLLIIGYIFIVRPFFLMKKRVERRDKGFRLMFSGSNRLAEVGIFYNKVGLFFGDLRLILIYSRENKLFCFHQFALAVLLYMGILPLYRVYTPRCFVKLAEGGMLDLGEGSVDYYNNQMVNYCYDSVIDTSFNGFDLFLLGKEEAKEKEIRWGEEVQYGFFFSEYMEFRIGDMEVFQV